MKLLLFALYIGEFKQRVKYHLQGKGCKKCGKIISSEKQKITNEEFILYANKVHNKKYDYSKVDMLNRDEKGRVCIICPTHRRVLAETK